MKGRPALWLVWLGAVVAILATARLGFWQLDRAAQKTAIAQSWRERASAPPLSGPELPRDAAGLAAKAYRRVTVEGRWLSRQTLYLDNRPQHGAAGFVVVTPLELAPGDAVLVQRGWAPRDPSDRARVPAAPLDEGGVRIEARIAPWPSPRLALSSVPESGPIRQNLDPAQLARDVGMALRPLSLLQLSTPDLPDALQREWPEPPQDVWKHQGYALQWFALSALIAGLALWYGWISPRRGQRS
ncbi:MAG TPA: SURF1 family protein [Burkholderiaceae bacterium]|nr:SURF1 family protein [Burkholderiaceae bacterium]